MKFAKPSQRLNRLCGRGTHLYEHGQVWQGWLIVPIRWPGDVYTVSYFSPTGVRYIDWSRHHQVFTALETGHQRVRSRLTSLSVLQSG